MTRTTVILLVFGTLVLLACSTTLAGEARVVNEYPPEELIDLRDDHTRVWKVARDVEITLPATGTTQIDRVESRYVEKGCGICYRDESGNFIPANPHWGLRGTNFNVTEASYEASIGTTLGTPLKFTADGESIELRLAKLAVQSENSSTDFRLVDPDASGSIDANDSTRLVFANALGPGIDVCYRVEPSGLHQDVILKDKEAVLTALKDQRSLAIYTALNIGTVSPDVIFFGPELVNLAGVGTLTSKSENDRLWLGNAFGAPPILFDASSVWDSPPAGGTPRFSNALRSLAKGSDGTLYYVEEVSKAYLDKTSFPVTCDYVTRSGEITADEVWERGETYYISSTLTVADGRLTIEPGVTVKIKADQKLSVAGNGQDMIGEIVAAGEYGAHITFTRSGDSNCGESTPGKLGAPTHCLELTAASSSGSVIRYCKFTYAASHLLKLDTPLTNAIAHNIFAPKNPDWNSSVYWTLNGVATIHLTNNLFVSCMQGRQQMAFTVSGAAGVVKAYVYNNTFRNYYESISIQPGTVVIAVVKDNFFENSNYPIEIASSGFHDIGYNGFYRCNNRVGDPIIILEEDPWDPSVLGYVYYNDLPNRGLALRKAGSRTVSEAGLFYPEFTVLKPPFEYTVSQIVDFPVTISGYDNWLSFYGDELDRISIGYHPPRVDCAIANGVDVVFTDVLTVEEGATVAMGRNSDTISIEGANGRLDCTGDPSHPQKGYNLFSDIYSLAAVDSSDTVYSPAPRSTTYGQLLILSGARPESTIQYSKFGFLYAGTASGVHTSASDRMRHNLWLNCYFGFFDEHNTPDTTTVQNCLAYRCSYGIYKYCNRPLEVQNCTSDGCWYGVYCGPGASPTLGVRHGIFSHCGFGLVADSPGPQVDARNVFCYNTFNRLIGGNPIASVADDSFWLSYSPWDRVASRERSIWYLTQDWKNLAVDTGAWDASSVFSGEGICTSSRDGSPDTGPVDPGFHWAKIPDSDGDEMSDQYEAFWAISDPNANHDSDHINVAAINVIECRGTNFVADADNPAFSLRPANGPIGTFSGDFHRQPYIQLKLANGAVIPNNYTMFWGTENPEFGSGWKYNRVWYSTVSEIPSDPNTPGPNWIEVRADNSPFSYVDNKDAQGNAENKRLHFAELTNLASDTTYYYYVQSRRDTGQWVTSTIRSFHTPRNLTPPSTSSFRILAMGDNRGEQNTGNHWDHLRIAKGILNHDSSFNYDLVFHTGDFVYDAGNDDGHEYRPQWDKHFFRPAAGFLSSHAVIAVAGDHEYRNDGTWNNGSHQFQHYFNEFHETVDAINRLWGWWDYGNCRFVFLDTERVRINEDETGNALTWLTNVLAGTPGGRWRIVLMHVPPCTDTTGHPWGVPGQGDVANCRENFASLFETNTVDIVIAGHSHVFERWVYDGDANGNGDDAADFQAGVNYIVTGGMGATLDNYNAHNPNRPRAFPPNATQGQESQFHYCTLEVNTDEAGNNDSTRTTLRVWRTTGEEWTDARCVFTRRN